MNEHALFVTFLGILAGRGQPAYRLGKQGLPVVFQPLIHHLVKQPFEEKAHLRAARNTDGRQIVAIDAKLPRGKAKALVEHTGYQSLHLSDTGEFCRPGGGCLPGGVGALEQEKLAQHRQLGGPKVGAPRRRSWGGVVGLQLK